VSPPPRVAVVTGAARGIGAATAVRLAAAGWKLVLFDRCEDDPQISYPLASRDDLDVVAKACGGPQAALSVVGDVRDQHALDGAVAAGVERFGGIDAALAVAGCIGGGVEAWRTPDGLWSTLLAVNLEGAWRLSKAAVPAMLERPEPRHGRFVAVTSAGGTVGIYMLAAYSAAKHGVVGLVRSLAAELGPHGITANAVAPGSTATAMLEASAALYGLERPEHFAEQHLLPRLIEPDEPAALIAWLCGPESSGVTGAVLPVDAGMTAR
jgi:SDR family mycofactocin-dependent oxidoreductase